MKPTENQEEELIAHIRKALKAQEEPYKIGAWEKFNDQQQTRKQPIFWMTRLAGVAATIAICFLLFHLIKPKTVKKDDLVKAKTNQIELKSKSENAVDRTNNLELENVEAKNKSNIGVNELSSLAIAKKSQKGDKIIATKVNIEDQLQTNNVKNEEVLANQNQTVIEQNTDQKIAAINEENSKINDFLIENDDVRKAIREKAIRHVNQKKWTFGLMLAPSIGNTDDLNLGYGLTMAYKMSDKLSLVTGFSYNEMSAGTDFSSNVSTPSILYGNNKSLAGINQKLTGLDIPLELKYNFNKNIYASAGLSVYAVFGQSRNNVFIQGVVVSGTGNSKISSVSASNSKSIDAKGQFANTYILNKKIIEPANIDGQKNLDFLGFYNLSIGYKKRILKNHSVAFEPYIKLPIKNVMQDNLKLIGTGLRLKVDF